MVYVSPSGMGRVALLMLASFGWAAWSQANHWSILAMLAVTAAGSVVAVLAIAVLDAARKEWYGGWQIEAGPVLAVTYRYLFGAAARTARYGLATVGVAHVDSQRRLVLRDHTGKVVLWLDARTRDAHPDLVASILDAVSTRGATTTTASPLTEQTVAAVRERREWLTTVRLRALDAALESDEAGPAPIVRRPWSAAKTLYLPARTAG